MNSGLLEKVKLFQEIQEVDISLTDSTMHNTYRVSCLLCAQAIGEVSILQEAVLHMQYQVFR